MQTRQAGRPPIYGKSMITDIHVRVQQDTLEKLDVLAKANRVKRSDMVRYIINHYVRSNANG